MRKRDYSEFDVVFETESVVNKRRLEQKENMFGY